MTVHTMGRDCGHCGVLPALAHGFCAACARYLALFPEDAPGPIVSVHDPRFERALIAWREGTNCDQHNHPTRKDHS